MAKARFIAKAKTTASARKKPVKAGTNRGHGGFPTQKVILITSKIKADIAKKKNNG